MTFGEYLRAARERWGIPAEQLARKCGISAQYLSDIEHDRRHPPRDRVVALIRGLPVCRELSPEYALYLAGYWPEWADGLSEERFRPAFEAFYQAIDRSKYAPADKQPSEEAPR